MSKLKNSTIPKKTESLEEIKSSYYPNNTSALEIIKDRFPDRTGFTVNIHRLWDNYYRVNYKNSFQDNFITESYWVEFIPKNMEIKVEKEIVKKE